MNQFAKKDGCKGIYEIYDGKGNSKWFNCDAVDRWESLKLAEIFSKCILLDYLWQLRLET